MKGSSTLCIAPRCKRARRPQRRYCERCQKRRWRAANPLRDAFLNLKSHAKSRGKVFDLSLAEFEALCHASGYLERKGQSAFGLTIDREDARLGYTATNLRVITRLENTRKQFAVDYPRQAERRAA